ncbi:MAG: HDOD domain-containing protein [Nibricoccus sp.]
MPAQLTFAEVCEKALRLPCSPALLPRLITVLENEDASIDELQEVIQIDPALASSTLRLANSAYFAAGSSKVENLGEALMRLGQKEVYRLAALSLASRWMTQKVEGYRWEAGDFCRLSLVTAVAAEYLAEETGRVDPKNAYTAGLVHEIGKLAVAHACAEQFPAVRTEQSTSGCTWLQAEKKILGFDHAEVGAELLRRWQFPPSLVAVGVHNPPKASDPADVLPLLVHVHAAKFLAVTIGAGVAEDGFLFQLNSDLLVEWGFTPEMLEQAIPEILERAGKLLRENLSHGSLSF